MKPRLFFLTVSLLAVLAVSACAPAQTASLPLPTADSFPATTVPVDTSSAPEATDLPPTQIADIQVVPTSLGPNLHATDPATVSLASGGLQLVEFFRFT